MIGGMIALYTILLISFGIGFVLKIILNEFGFTLDDLAKKRTQKYHKPTLHTPFGRDE